MQFCSGRSLLLSSQKIALLLTLLSSVAFSFPEMIRHGYVNCLTCHISPNGGGILTPYGRSLSEQVISTWHTENEGKSVNDQVGGDVRAVQLYSRNKKATFAKFILMQADIEVALPLRTLTLVGSVGRSDDGYIDSHKHYALYQPIERLSLRAGRFQEAYGINLPEHVATIKRGLGWDYSSETYNLEASWSDEKWDAFLTGTIGRPGESYDQAISARTSYTFFDTLKLGMSGHFSPGKRTLFGPYAIFGFTKSFFLLAEVDIQKTKVWDTYQYLRLDYEWLQGLHSFILWEGEQSYGIGLQWFPRPHFELQGVWEKQATADFAWLLFHYWI